jgi:hypothetical protein
VTRVLSEKAKAGLEKFLAEDARVYDDAYNDLASDPYSKILTWARDPEYGSLPEQAACPFANWLSNEWANWTEEPGRTVKEILEGAVSDFCGGRTF